MHQLEGEGEVIKAVMLGSIDTKYTMYLFSLVNQPWQTILLA